MPKKSIDADTSSGKFLLTVFGAMVERAYILHREGIAEARKAGKYKGRKPAFCYTM